MLQQFADTTIIKRCQLEINAVPNNLHVVNAAAPIGAVPNLLSLFEADHCHSAVLCCKQQTQAALSEVYAPKPDTTATLITSPTVTASLVTARTLRCPSEV